MSGFGPEIREARLRKGVSLRSLARGVGISAAFLSDIERGRRSFGVQTAAKISQQLGIELVIPMCPNCARPMPGYPQREWATTHVTPGAPNE